MDKIENEAGRAIVKPNGAKPSSEGISIPKHRFDCVNLAFKETKESLREKNLELERYKTRITELEKQLAEIKAETALEVFNMLNRSITSYIKRNGSREK